jgi:hypothetical protein
MPNTTTATRAPLHTITLATIEGDKTTYSATRAPSHTEALKKARENTSATLRAYYTPFGTSLPLCALHVTVSTLSGIAKRAKPADTAQQAVTGDNYGRIIAQLGVARYTLHAMAQHGPEVVTIPLDIQDYFQTAALTLLNHTAPLATVTPSDIQEAYRLAMCAVQKAYRADTRGAQQAEAGKEMPRLYGSPTMPRSNPQRPAPKAYIDAINAIRQALPSEQARAILDAWKEHPEASTRELTEYVDGKKSMTAKHVARIRKIANALYPDGIPTR